MSDATYARVAAGLIVELVRETGSRAVAREALRERWIQRFPHHATSQMVRSARAHERHRRRTYLAGSHHSSGSLGTKVKKYLGGALRVLEDCGAIVREEELVRVVDVRALVAVRDGKQGVDGGDTE